VNILEIIFIWYYSFKYSCMFDFFG